MTVSKRAAVLLVTLLFLSWAPSVTGAVAVQPDSAPNPTVGGGDQFQTDTPPANETTPHRNPDRVNKDGDSEDVRQWLADTLGDRLSESAIQISQGQYEAGRQLLGDGYNELLEKYVDVSGETDAASDDQAKTAREFQQAQRQQQQVASTTSQYQQTLNKYREARQNGNTTRARQLARKLNRLAGQITQTTTNLTQTYDEISNETGVRLRNATQSVTAVQTNITTRQEAINEDLFVDTNLSVSAQTSEISFRSPTVVTGRLSTENRSNIVNRTVTLQIAGQVVQTSTDSQGRFEFLFRPTLQPIGRQNIPVSFVPTDTSVYLGSHDVITVAISQVQPTLRVDVTPETAGFGDRVTVTGRVAAADIRAANVPVAITLGSVSLGHTRTTPNGSFTAVVRVPAAVANGSQALRAHIPLDNRAVAATNASQTVLIRSTTTELHINATTQNQSTVRVTGQLTTASQTPVAGQSVTLSITGRQLGTVQTGVQGRFNTTVNIGQSVGSTRQGREITLVATYAGTETNLEAAQATTAVQLQPSSAPHEQTGWLATLRALVGNPLVWIAALAVGGVGMVSVLRRRRDTVMSGDSDGADAADQTGSGSADAAIQPAETTATEDRFLRAARDHLTDGEYDAAVRAAYGAARDHATRLVDLSEGSTHWDCYATCASAEIEGDQLATLRDLTELYERAAFAPESLEERHAERALTNADEFTTTSDRDN